MELYVFDVTGLIGREDEALERLAPGRRAKALRLRRQLPRLQSIGAGLLLARFFPGRESGSGPHGKPFIPGGREFSLSHSGPLAVIALADVPVGADVQQVRPVRDSTLGKVLAPAEREGGDFFVLWTRKEAALKCLGTGLDRDLRSLDVREDALALDGMTVCLHTERYKDCLISAAACGASAVFAPLELTADDLLPRKE